MVTFCAHLQLLQFDQAPSPPALQVVPILVAMAPKILVLATWFVKKVFLTQKSWLPNGDQAKTLTWRVANTHYFIGDRFKH